MNNKISFILLLVFASLILVCLQCPLALGCKEGEDAACAELKDQKQSPSVLKTRGIVDSVDQHRHKMVVNDSLMDLPPGVPSLRPGDIIEMEFEKKSGKVFRITRVGVDKKSHKPSNGSGERAKTRSAFKGNHGQIRKVDGKWQNY